MTLDYLATEPQYAAHLRPLWDALPEGVRGLAASKRKPRITDAVLVASGSDLALAKRLGYKRIAYLEHGIGQTYGGLKGYPGGKDRGDVSLFLSPNETAASADRAAYPAARIEVVGDPRLDTLPNREPGPPVICTSFHWDAAGAKPWPLSALSHYRAVLPALAERFPLIGHAHPKAARTLQPLYKRLGIEFVPDFDDVLRRADLYIADNTSTLYEFASTGRPVVVLNAPWFDRKVELGLRFWAAAKVGFNVDETYELLAGVELALADPEPLLAHREAALDIAYAYRHGAAQRAADAVVEWLGAGRPSVSAGVEPVAELTAERSREARGYVGPAVSHPYSVHRGRPAPGSVPLKEVILVPRRADNGPRDVLWAWCKAWWEREQSHMPIFEGHHEAGLFNRSAAVNRAAALAGDWDVAVIIDSDVIMNPERVKEAVAKANETGQMVLPHDMRKDLNQRGTDLVMSGYAGNWEKFVHRRYPDMVSSVVVIPRRLWDEIGGFDETFAGWGYEDTAFAAAAQTFGGIIRTPGELWHLFHPTAKEGRPGTATWSLNSSRGQRYRAAIGNREAIRALQAERPLPVTSTGIPPILHRVVPEKPDPQAEAWWKRFGEMHPGWTLLTHRDPLVPAEWPLTSRKWSRCANGAQLADLVRLEALLRWGGIYVDQDVEPCRPLDPLLSLQAFAAWEDERCVPNAVMGATPDHPAIQACLDLALSRIPGDTWKAGPGVTTEILPGRNDVLLLPPESFYPVWYRDPDRDAKMDGFDPRQHPATFVLHRYWGSWLAKPARELVAV